MSAARGEVEMVVTSAQVRSLCSVTLFGGGQEKDKNEEGDYEDDDGRGAELTEGITTTTRTTMKLGLDMGGSSGWNWDPG